MVRVGKVVYIPEKKEANSVMCKKKLLKICVRNDVVYVDFFLISQTIDSLIHSMVVVD